MPVIKRYANRKLYDTDSKRYVTLEDLAEFIRQGEDVRVVDHVTGEDLTSVTLLQVVFEEEKKIGGLLPQVFLTRLIRTGGDTLSALRSRLVAMDPFQMVDEEIRRRVQTLVEQGGLSESEGQRFQDLLLHRQADPARTANVVHIPVKVEEETAQAPGAGAAASAEAEADPQEVEALMRQVDLLEQELQKLKSSATPPGQASI